MDKQRKARQREYRSAVRMMIAARHEAEHGRYKKAKWMIRKAWMQGKRVNRWSAEDVIRVIYHESTELGLETMETLSALIEAIRKERRF